MVTTLLFVSFLSFAQDFSSDTIILRIEKISAKKKKATAYNLATESAWKNGNFNDALEYSTRGLKIAKKNKFKSIESKLHNNRGIAYDYLSDYPSALKHYFAGLSIQEKLKDPKTKGDILGNIGLIYMYQEINDKPIVSFASESISMQAK